MALGRVDRADVVQHLRQVKLDVRDLQLVAFDGGHVQHVVDDAQQHPRRGGDLIQTAVHPFGRIVMLLGDLRQADDGVHGRAYLVAHARQKLALCDACAVSLHHCLRELTVGFLQLELAAVAHDDDTYQQPEAQRRKHGGQQYLRAELVKEVRGRVLIRRGEGVRYQAAGDGGLIDAGKAFVEDGQERRVAIAPQRQRGMLRHDLQRQRRQTVILRLLQKQADDVRVLYENIGVSGRDGIEAFVIVGVENKLQIGIVALQPLAQRLKRGWHRRTQAVAQV